MPTSPENDRQDPVRSDDVIYSSLATPLRAQTLAGFVALAALLAALGAVPMADHMTYRVMGLVEGIPWADWWRPFHSPPPLDTWGARPLSVLFIKLWLAGAGVFDAPGPLVRFLRATVLLLAYGVAARAWLCTVGFQRTATLAAVLPMLLPPALFSAWYLPEMDTLGAAAVLGAAALVGDPRPLGRRWALAVPLIALAVLLKESSALLLFAFLGAGMLTHLAAGRRELALRHGVPLAVGGLAWSILTLGMMSGRRSMLATVSWIDRLPIVEHNAAQLVYLVSPVGAALIALGALRPARWRRRAWVPPALALALLLVAPPLVIHDHFQAMYGSPRWLPTVAAVALLLGLVGRLQPSREVTRRRLVALTTLAALGGVSLGVLMSDNAREDIASRLFLSLAPALHATALEGAWSAYAANADRRGLLARLGRVSAVALAVAFCWYPLAGAFNYAGWWRAWNLVDREGRELLVREPLEESLLTFNDHVHRVGPGELRALGAPEAVSLTTRFAAVPVWLDLRRLPTVDWGFGAIDVQAAVEQDVRVYLYWLSPRSLDDPRARAALMGDLSWTRRDMGVFTPMVRDEVEEGPDGPILHSTRVHNLMEDARYTTWGDAPAPLEALAASLGELAWRLERPYVQVPQRLLEVPRRLVDGVPLVERYRYEAALYRLGPPPGVEPLPYSALPPPPPLFELGSPPPERSKGSVP